MTPEEAEFLGTVVTVARTIPRELLDNLCERLEQLPSEAAQRSRLSLALTIVQTKARETLSRLLVLWCDKAPNLSPPSLAWALRAACRADEFRRTWQSLELVWTGPAPAFSALRRTDQALLDLIQGAQRSVFIVTFAAYKIPEIVAALTKAAQRGVAVTLIMESAEESGGKTTFETVDAMGEQLRNEAVIYVLSEH